uniref:Uncharacterized protein n=1 Tax=Arundo donax TaxID=35708 RepID=A0A0A9B2N2_ARUDO
MRNHFMRKWPMCP